MNGEIIPWEDAKVHVRTEGFMRGASVFEGIRAYASPDGRQLYVFKGAEHTDRLFHTSMKILRMQLTWTAEDLIHGMVQLLRANTFHADVHIRPQVYFGMGEDHGFDPARIEVGCVITAVERPAKPSLWNGIHVRVSSWRRIGDETMPPRVKAGANYLNSRYAMMEARLDGYDSAIFLNAHGKVAEGPGACVMIVRHGKVIAPPATAGVLESITKSTLVQLFRSELDVDVVEREIDRTELYVADEVFFCGTGYEVQPIVSVDRYTIGTGEPGSVVKRMQDLYFNIARGQNPKYSQWLRPVYPD
ncbi:MAG: branched-chain amino acid transaminase [Armatimonadetes bacterium]|nr:branched-chain amino acid transaminase [Armatimonadota bacterium]